MEWRSYTPLLVALVLFLLVGSIFEKRIEAAIRRFIEYRHLHIAQHQRNTTVSTQSASDSDALKVTITRTKSQQGDESSKRVTSDKLKETTSCVIDKHCVEKKKLASTATVNTEILIQNKSAESILNVALGIKEPIESSTMLENQANYIIEGLEKFKRCDDNVEDCNIFEINIPVVPVKSVTVPLGVVSCSKDINSSALKCDSQPLKRNFGRCEFDFLNLIPPTATDISGEKEIFGTTTTLPTNASSKTSVHSVKRGSTSDVRVI